jgi:hypothetical protein
MVRHKEKADTQKTEGPWAPLRGSQFEEEGAPDRRREETSKKVAYISGPMSGYPDWNFPAFHEAEENLRSLGYRVLNPARNFGGRTDLPREKYMREDITMLLEADTVFALPGWGASRGAQLEIAIAHALGIPVYDYDARAVIPPPPPEQITPFITTSPPTTVAAAQEGICREADRVVSTARRDSYGHPRENFEHTAKLWSAYSGREFSPEEVAVFMILLKLSRLHHRVTRDTLVDIAGYAKTISILEGWEA